MADIKVWSDPSLLSKDRLMKELAFFNVAHSSSASKKTLLDIYASQVGVHKDNHALLAAMASGKSAAAANPMTPETSRSVASPKSKRKVTPARPSTTTTSAAHPMPEWIVRLSGKDLKANLKNVGVDCTGMNGTTRPIYEEQLRQALENGSHFDQVPATTVSPAARAAPAAPAAPVSNGLLSDNDDEDEEQAAAAARYLAEILARQAARKLQQAAAATAAKSTTGAATSEKKKKQRTPYTKQKSVERVKTPAYFSNALASDSETDAGSPVLKRRNVAPVVKDATAPPPAGAPKAKIAPAFYREEASSNSGAFCQIMWVLLVLVCLYLASHWEESRDAICGNIPGADAILCAATKAARIGSN